MTFKQAITPRTLCAGQGCADRKGCQRFRARGPGGDYASFDIERQRFVGPCPHRVAIVRPRRDA